MDAIITGVVNGLEARYEQKLRTTDLLRAWADCDAWGIFTELVATVSMATDNFAAADETRLLRAADDFDLAGLQALVLRAVMLRTMELENPERPAEGRVDDTARRLAQQFVKTVSHELRTSAKLGGWSRGNPKPYVWAVWFSVLQVGHDLVWAEDQYRRRVAERLLDTVTSAVLLRDLIVGKRPVRRPRVPQEAARFRALAAAPPSAPRPATTPAGTSSPRTTPVLAPLGGTPRATPFQRAYACARADTTRR